MKNINFFFNFLIFSSLALGFACCSNSIYAAKPESTKQPILKKNHRGDHTLNKIIKKIDTIIYAPRPYDNLKLNTAFDELDQIGNSDKKLRHLASSFDAFAEQILSLDFSDSLLDSEVDSLIVQNALLITRFFCARTKAIILAETGSQELFAHACKTHHNQNIKSSENIDSSPVNAIISSMRNLIREFPSRMPDRSKWSPEIENTWRKLEKYVSQFVILYVDANRVPDTFSQILADASKIPDPTPKPKVEKNVTTSGRFTINDDDEDGFNAR